MKLAGFAIRGEADRAERAERAEGVGHVASGLDGNSAPKGFTIEGFDMGSTAAIGRLGVKFRALDTLGLTVATFFGSEAEGSALALGSKRLDGRLGDNPLLLLLSMSDWLQPTPTSVNRSAADF